MDFVQCCAESLGTQNRRLLVAFSGQYLGLPSTLRLQNRGLPLAIGDRYGSLSGAFCLSDDGPPRY